MVNDLELFAIRAMIKYQGAIVDISLFYSFLTA